ncbi:MAG: hydrolase 1, exosortase A system-associated [Alphaproteobacteria bacterium]|nr:MAG: hydrolase 1, exosortase A system-associated [Alphaproteobacteria bacterium]
MENTETAFAFTNNAQHQLIGIIHHPAEVMSQAGLLIVVGGPQYRIGAHRQYVHLARHCAKQGIPVMRFDYQGIGDSAGVYPGFEHVAPDIHEAIDQFITRVPEIKSVAIWGLCEGASAILLGGADHKAASHIILANPWVRSESGLAKAYVKHYYFERLLRPEFWKKIFSGKLNIKSAISGLFSNIKKAFVKERPENTDNRAFPDRMLSGLQRFQGEFLLISSQNDLVAREFDDLTSADKEWRQTLKEKQSTRVDIAGSDHTFSTEEWRKQVAACTVDWLLTSDPSGQ